MIRFILKRKFKACDSAEDVSFQTFDAECPELEINLQRGGWDQHSYDHFELVGIEILKPQPKGPSHE